MLAEAAQARPGPTQQLKVVVLLLRKGHAHNPGLHPTCCSQELDARSNCLAAQALGQKL
jgi:hypothetical protein